MNLSSEQRAKLIASTNGAAVALVEDLVHLREIVGRQQHTPAELRRSSAVLRRLIIDEDIRGVAAPRIGKLHLRMPDFSPYYRISQLCPIDYFGGAGEATMAMFPPNMPRAIIPQVDQLPKGAHRIVHGRLDGFQAQKIMCFQGTWVTRASVIKHIANAGSGVHTEKSSDPQDKVLRQLRRCAKYTRKPDGTFEVRLLWDGAKFHEEVDLKWDFVSIDPLLTELLATMKLIVESEDVIRLEAAIREEMGELPA